MQRIFFGITILLLGAFLAFKNTNPINTEPVRQEGFKQTPTRKDREPERVIIPSVSIDLSIKRAEIVDGYWQVFEDSAAWGEGSGYPGETGNQVIFAHAREGLFLPLKEVKKEAQIYVMRKDKSFSYKVTEIKEVLPNQIEVVSPTDDETLTLYTCSGYQDSKRLIVVSKRV